MNKKDITETIGAVIQDSNGKTLLQFHNKTGKWTIPIGKVDPGERVDTGLKREMREELGIEITHATLLLVDDDDHILEWFDQYLNKTWYFRLNLFRIDKYTGDITNMEPQKHREFKWFSKDELFKIREDDLTTATKTYIKLKYGKDYKFDEFRLSEEARETNTSAMIDTIMNDTFQEYIVSRIERTFTRLCELVPFSKMTTIMNEIMSKGKSKVSLIDGEYEIEIEEQLDFSGEYAQFPKKIMVDKTIVGNKERMVMVLAHEMSHHVGRSCEMLNKDTVQFLETEGYTNQYLYYVCWATNDKKRRATMLDDPEVVDGIISKPNIEFKHEAFAKSLVEKCKRIVR